MIRHFLTVILFSTTLWAANSVVSAKDFLPEKVKFTFMSSDGSVWINCSHKKTDIPHGWDVTCGDKKLAFIFLCKSTRAKTKALMSFITG